MAKDTVKVIEVPAIEPQIVKLTIIGDSDLVINKMNDATKRLLTDQRNDKAKDTAKPNKWEEIVTAIHWVGDYKQLKPEQYTEKTLEQRFKTASPAISAFGLKKQLNKAVVRNKIDTYSTGFDANVNIIAEGNLIPIKFAEHFIDEKLMSPKRGAPVLARLNRFTGWSAEISVAYMDNVYSLPSIISIFNLAGFGIGVGSGTTSGYGRFHVANVGGE